MKVKTADLIGEPLNWAAAKCEEARGLKIFSHPDFPYVGYEKGRWSPSTDQGQGGEIIDRKGISTITKGFLNDPGRKWMAYVEGCLLVAAQFGPTRLVAAMRYLVASEAGDEIDVPDELLK